MARHPIDIILILLRARLGQEVEPLTQADKSRLMDVIQAAGQHGVGPALHGGLKVMMDQGKADGWQSVAPMLKILEEQNAARNRQVREVCLRINSTLRAAGIKPVFLKGCSFIIEDEEAAPWRFVSDIDVLVAPEQAQQAFDHLREAGWSAPLDPSRYHDRLHHHLPPLIDDNSGLAIELHSRVLQELDTGILETPGIMAAAKAVSLPGGDDALVLSPADRALHAVLHCQHSNRAYRLRLVEIKSLLDYAMLLDDGGFGDKALRQACEASPFTNEICSFVELASLLIGTSGLPSQMKNTAWSKWAEQAELELTAPPSQAVRTARLVKSYLISFIKNPGRTLTLFGNLKDKRFRADLTKATNRWRGL